MNHEDRKALVEKMVEEAYVIDMADLMVTREVAMLNYAKFRERSGGMNIWWYMCAALDALDTLGYKVVKLEAA